MAETLTRTSLTGANGVIFSMYHDINAMAAPITYDTAN